MRRGTQGLLDWGVASGCVIESRAISSTFGLSCKSIGQIFFVTLTGHLYLFLEERKFPGGVKERASILADLKDLELFDPDLDPATLPSSQGIHPVLWFCLAAG